MAFTYFGFNLGANRIQTSGSLVGEECFGGVVCHIQTGLEIAAVTLHWAITTTPLPPHLLLRRERGVGQGQLQLVHGHEGVVAVHPVQVANCHSWEVNLIKSGRCINEYNYQLCFPLYVVLNVTSKLHKPKQTTPLPGK